MVLGASPLAKRNLPPRAGRVEEVAAEEEDRA
jgi:hypothetical protein